MHDGAVVFDTRLNNKTLERDYAKVVKRIEDLKDEIDVKTNKRSGLVAQADAMVGALDEAKAKLYEMQTAGKGVFSAEEIQRQKENVDQLQSRWNGIQNSVDRYTKEITQAADKLDVQEKKGARLTQKIEEAAAAQRGFGDATQDAATRLEKMGNRIKQLVVRALVFSVIARGLRMMRDWMSEVVMKNDETAAAVARLKGALLTLAQPLLTVVIPVFTALVNLLTAVIGKIATFLSLLSGKTVQQSAAAAKALEKQGKAYEDVGKSAKEASRQLLGFDELNKLEDTNVSTGGTGDSSTEIAPDFSWTEGVTETMEKLAGWVMVIAAGLALWKIGTMFTGPLGIILTTVGKLAAGIGLVVAGLILLASGFQDAFENGLKMENVLTIIAGIIATGLGISILAGSWIPLLVAGILGLLVAIANLTGNGGEMIEGFRELFGGLSDFITGVFTGDWERAWEGLIATGRGAVNVLISIINSLIDLAVAGLNLIQVDVPDWVPIIGGRHFGFNIQNPPQIPYLAQGAVIPPNREFMAVLGDQKHGNNIEAPEDLIRKIVREETAGMGGSARLEELLEILINTVEGIEVGDETIGKAAARYSRSTARARGT